MKIYEKTWFIIVMLIVFFPVGLFLMWKYSNWNKVVKIIISVIFGLALIVNMFGGSSDNKKPVEDKQPANQEEVVEDSAADVTSDDFVKALNSFLNDDAFIMNETLLGCKVDKDVVKIDVDLKSIDESWKQFTPDIQVENSFDCIVDSITTDCLMDDKYVDMWKSLAVTFYEGDQKIASIKRDKSDVKYEKSQEGTKYEHGFYYFDYELSDFKWFIDESKLDKTTQYEINEKKESKRVKSNSDSWTMEQKNCYKSAQSYLNFAPFSKQGLIDQLSSEYADNYPVNVAEFAVNQLEKRGEVNWDEQCEKAAKNYLDMMSFSKEELIQQLSSDAGDQYTREQAERAVEKVYQ